MLFKIGVLKNIAIFTGKHLCWSLFLMKVQAWSPSCLYSNTGVFLWMLQRGSEQILDSLWNQSCGCFCNIKYQSCFNTFCHIAVNIFCFFCFTWSYQSSYITALLISNIYRPKYRQSYSWVCMFFSFLLPINHLKSNLLYESLVGTLNKSFLLL